MILNFNQLATSPQRKQALLISEAGISALAIKPIMQKVWYDGRKDVLFAQGQKFSLDPFQHVILVGLGTGSLTAAGELANALGNRLTAGLIIDEQEGQVPRILSRRATAHHSIANHSLTKELMALARDCSDDDVIITVITGGNDLLSAPAGMMLEDKRAIINALIKSGASPAEIETVKRHLSLVKGGNLAKLAYPAAMINLIFDDPGILGGPTIRDETTIHDAREILQRYGALEKCGLASCQLFETPKEESYFEKVNNVHIPVRQFAKHAMAGKARDLGFRISPADSLSEVKSGEVWIGQDALPELPVAQMPEQGLLLNFDGQRGSILDAAALANARSSKLAELSADNWAENLDTFSLSDRFSRVVSPLSLYLKP